MIINHGWKTTELLLVQYGQRIEAKDQQHESDEQ